jgi:GNAT superfamily N-acetyltransferase
MTNKPFSPSFRKTGPLTPNYVIRELSSQDVAWVRNFWVEHWGGETMVVHGQTFTCDGLSGFVAEDNNRVFGLITYRLEGETCEVMSLDSLLERQGVASRLLAKVIEAAKAAGCQRLVLTTTNDNLNALRFYQKRGLRLSAIHPGAVDEARRLKPNIPFIGDFGITIRDEIELELNL